MMKKVLVATALTGTLVAGGFTLQAQNTNQTANAEQVVQKKSSFVSKKQAEKAALKVVKGYVDDVDLERKKGKWVYEVEIKKGDFEYKVYVDAKTGKALNDPVKEKKQNVKITKKQAEKTALAKVKGTVTDSDLDKENGVYIYEIEITTPNGEEVDFEISAKTGKILKQEWDD
ncbi:PepSY domain-containing protein [Bacillus safensis]|uniref:PepSY domain-containing protein n=1 Tax=Bacillus safensis TaxID=561879 RepID=UPI002DB9BE8F|nr:PepSY domain-containing protein [Bacillus safensis]MEC1409366.1 PepSY domain-containing protein [Bacillus safensis]